MPAIELQRVHKSYGATHVVKGLSMDVAAGELVTLLGPSGCGKTTTLRMIAGLEFPDEGRIVIEGQEVASGRVRVPPEERGLGMVFQSYAIWPHRSVAQNVAYPLRLKRWARAAMEARVTEALRWVRLEPLANRMPHELSGGQLQRVALARALAADPRVLLLDEPLSNLDAALREELRAEIAALRARLGTTMIYVTHDQAEALALSDRVAVMNGGVVEQIADPQTLYRHPATPFVAGFVGGANLLSGVLRGSTFVSDGGPSFTWASAPPSAGGRGTLVIRPEHLELGAGGTPLVLSARLFLGHATEYRFATGDGLLRALGPAQDVRTGALLEVRITTATFFASEGSASAETVTREP